MDIKTAFNQTLTANGDKAFLSTNNEYMDILFSTESYRKNDRMPFLSLSDLEFSRKFALFVRDARVGLGERDLGRKLFKLTKESPENILMVGRADDIFYLGFESYQKGEKNPYYDFLMQELKKENALVQKWMPRKKVKKNAKTGKNEYRNIAEVNSFLEYFQLSDRAYRKLVKVTTTETHLTNKALENIVYEQVPSLAMLKYTSVFRKKDRERFKAYLEAVEQGKSKLNVSTATVYDIFLKYENDKDAQSASLLFENLPKLNVGRTLPIIDNSGSMYDTKNSYLKARSIGYYVARNNTFMKNHFIVFSDEPRLATVLGDFQRDYDILNSFRDVGSTNFALVMQRLAEVTEELPDYLLVLSDMQFDEGSAQRKDVAMKLLRKNHHQIKIIWWNFCSNYVTIPETDEYGNIFLSGYNPRVLEFLDPNFSFGNYVDNLVAEYWEKMKSLLDLSHTA